MGTSYAHVRDAFYSGEHAFTGDRQTVIALKLLSGEFQTKRYH